MVWMDLTNFTSCSGVAENGLKSTVLLLQITLWALAGRALPALASSMHLVGACKPSGALGEREVVNYSREDVCRRGDTCLHGTVDSTFRRRPHQGKRVAIPNFSEARKRVLSHRRDRLRGA